MKNILLFTVAILFIGINSNSEVLALTGSFEEKDVYLAEHTFSMDEYRKGSDEAKKYEFAEQHQSAEQNRMENAFFYQNAGDTDFTFELMFFLGVLGFMAFLIALQYQSKPEEAVEFRQFD